MTENSLKISHKFVCKKCDYSTSKKSDYSKHLFTLKHQNNDNDDINNDNFSQKNSKSHICECGRIYKYRQGLCYHKKTCELKEPQESSDSISANEDKEETELKILTNRVWTIADSNLRNNLVFITFFSEYLGKLNIC